MPTLNVSKTSGVIFVTRGTQNPVSYINNKARYVFSDDDSLVTINIGNDQYTALTLTELRVNGQTPASASTAKVLLNAVLGT